MNLRTRLFRAGYLLAIAVRAILLFVATVAAFGTSLAEITTGLRSWYRLDRDVAESWDQFADLGMA